LLPTGLHALVYGPLNVTQAGDSTSLLTVVSDAALGSCGKLSGGGGGGEDGAVLDGANNSGERLFNVGSGAHLTLQDLEVRPPWLVARWP
jgi:hypothetical protein